MINLLKVLLTNNTSAKLLYIQLVKIYVTPPQLPSQSKLMFY